MTAALAAQQAQENDTIFRADTRIVVCHTTVIDDRPPGDYLQYAFTVYESKVKREIRSSAKTFRSRSGW